jgi:hypothetical protein
MRIEVHGREYLLCEMVGCLWNAGCISGDPGSMDDPEYEPEPGVGTRICNYGHRAVVLGLPVPESCPHRTEVRELVEVKAGNGKAAAVETIDSYIRKMANEARARLGLAHSEVAD